MPIDLAGAVSAADDLWSAFHDWLKILEDVAGALDAGHAVRLHDKRARQAARAAAKASSWHDELMTYFAAFDKASESVAVWTDVGEPPRGTGGAYMWIHVRDARIALQHLAGFLFARLQALVREEGARTVGGAGM